MKIKHGMILAAGLGKRMLPLTLKKPKPLLHVGKKSLLERAINILINNGVEEICINTHHLSKQIEEYVSTFKSKVDIRISKERDLLLDTGGGVKEATKKFNEHPFFVINPDTLWDERYFNEINLLERLYFKDKTPCILLVKKDLSFDKSFKGDFNLKDSIVLKEKKNNFIFTGLQIITRKNLEFIEEKKFSMNEVWNKLIEEKKLNGLESQQIFYHLNTLEMYKKICILNTND